MLYTIGSLLVVGGAYIANPVIICAGIFVIIASNRQYVKVKVK